MSRNIRKKTKEPTEKVCAEDTSLRRASGASTNIGNDLPCQLTGVKEKNRADQVPNPKDVDSLRGNIQSDSPDLPEMVCAEDIFLRQASGASTDIGSALSCKLTGVKEKNRADQIPNPKELDSLRGNIQSDSPDLPEMVCADDIFLRQASGASTDIGSMLPCQLTGVKEKQNVDQVINPKEDSCSTSSGSSNSCDCYASPKNTLLFLDWDDTLFPSTELEDMWCMQKWSVQQGSWRWKRPSSPSLDEQQRQELESWQDALEGFLCAASEFATCIIVTNAKPGWVESCIQAFAPRLMQHFERYVEQIVYAQDLWTDMKRRKKVHTSSLTPVKQTFEDGSHRARRRVESLVASKLEAMRIHAKAFYKRSPEQSWKNIISFGDQTYERDALQELGMRRIAPKPEHLRIKTLLLPDRALVSSLSLRLDILSMFVPAFVKYDGDLDIDLQDVQNLPDPLKTLFRELGLPDLIDAATRRCLWSAVHDSKDCGTEDALGELSESFMDYEDYCKQCKKKGG